ncbi:MAG: homoserine O-acetyltransferase, partial [Acidobacteria bacterium]|nr:homoserine O-acetyltransferase [Acidobacteriota bacterium]
LNAARDNAILVCHALSGSARVAAWWAEMFGSKKAFDTSRYCIIGTNVIGSCYGSTGPSSINEQTGKAWRGDFPVVTVSDMVRAQGLFLNHLGVKRLHAVIGGSIGGMQALQWAVDFPEKIERCIAVGAAPLSAMGLALNHLQRQAIQNDPRWQQGRYNADDPPVAGLALARALAMCTYKSPELFNERFGRRPDRSGEDPYTSMNGRFDVAGYLDYQGQIFNNRFDANSYIVLSKAMDAFDFARGYGSEEAALRRISARVSLVGISSDWLFPASNMKALAARMRAMGVDASYGELASPHGHDAFLADARLLAPLVSAALDEHYVGRELTALAAAGNF